MDLSALTEIIRKKQLEVAHGFFGIHYGAYNFEFEAMPELRFTTITGSWTKMSGRGPEGATQCH